MLDTDTLVPRPTLQPALPWSELIALALFRQWVQFNCERAFYRYAQWQLCAAFLILPDRAQFNHQHHDAIVAFFQHIMTRLRVRHASYQVLNGTEMVTRNAK